MAQNKTSKILMKYRYPLIVLGLMLILTVVAPHSFPTINNTTNVLWSISVVGIMVSGSIFVILTGGIDLSVGSMLALSGVVLVKIITYYNYMVEGLVIAILVTLFVGMVVGLIHGIVITSYSVPPFLVTFSTQIILTGIAMLLTNNEIISCPKPEYFMKIGLGKFLGVPMPIYIMGVFIVLSYFLLNKTVFGRYVYSVGGNAVASKLSGVSPNKITIISYVLSGLTAAVGGIVLASMTQQCMATAGRGYETRVITACVIGGVSLMGGTGTITGAFAGSIIVGLVYNGLNLLNVPATYHGLVLGIVIIVAVGIDSFSRKEKKFVFPMFTRRATK